jgi:hypothetical protein
MGPKTVSGSSGNFQESGSISPQVCRVLRDESPPRWAGGGSVSPHPPQAQGCPCTGSQTVWVSRGGLDKTFRAQGRAGASDTHTAPASQLLVPLHFVRRGMRMTATGWLDKGSWKHLGVAHPHVQALLSERNYCLGDREPEKALVCQVDTGKNTMTAAARRVLTRPCPQTTKHWRGSRMATVSESAWVLPSSWPQATSGPRGGRLPWLRVSCLGSPTRPPYTGQPLVNRLFPHLQNPICLRQNQKINSVDFSLHLEFLAPRPEAQASILYPIPGAHAKGTFCPAWGWQQQSKGLWPCGPQAAGTPKVLDEGLAWPFGPPCQ